MTGWLDRRATPLWLGLVAGLLAVAAGLLAGGDAAERAGLAARWTARAGLSLFLVAFLASTLVRRWPRPATRPLLRRRRQWGLGFALAHMIHPAALGINVIVDATGRTWQSLIGGRLAYVGIYLMALTSTDGWQRRLGKGWGRLHWSGIYYIWSIFIAIYAGRAVGSNPDKRVVGIVFGTVMIAAFELRLWSVLRDEKQGRRLAGRQNRWGCQAARRSLEMRPEGDRRVPGTSSHLSPFGLTPRHRRNVAMPKGWHSFEAVAVTRGHIPRCRHLITNP